MCDGGWNQEQGADNKTPNSDKERTREREGTMESLQRRLGKKAQRLLPAAHLEAAEHATEGECVKRQNRLNACNGSLRAIEGAS